MSEYVTLLSYFETGYNHIHVLANVLPYRIPRGGLIRNIIIILSINYTINYNTH